MVKSVKSSVPLLRLVIELTLPNSNGKQHEVFAEAAGHAKGFYTKGAPAKIGNNAICNGAHAHADITGTPRVL